MQTSQLLFDFYDHRRSRIVQDISEVIRKERKTRDFVSLTKRAYQLVAEPEITPHRAFVNQCFGDLWSKVEEFRKLDADWDDNNAASIKPVLVTIAQTFITHLASNLFLASHELLWMPSVFPTREGGIELYWNRMDDQRAITFLPDLSGIEFRFNTVRDKKRELVSISEAHRKAFLAISGR